MSNHMLNKPKMLWKKTSYLKDKSNMYESHSSKDLPDVGCELQTAEQSQELQIKSQDDSH